MILCFLALLGQVKPITPIELNQAMLVPVRGAEADELAKRVRASFPEGTDLKLGKHAPLIQEDAVAFVIEAPGEPAPRVAGMVNHGRGLDMLPIGETGLWVRVEPIPPDTKFSYLVPAREGDLRRAGRRDARVEVSARVERAARPELRQVPAAQVPQRDLPQQPHRLDLRPGGLRSPGTAPRAHGLPGRRRVQERACRHGRRQPDRRRRDAGDAPACS